VFAGHLQVELTTEILCFTECIGEEWMLRSRKHLSAGWVAFQVLVHFLFHTAALWCTVNQIRGAGHWSSNALNVYKWYDFVSPILCLGEPSHGGMQSGIFLCLSKTRINWEGCGRNCIRHKSGGGVLMEVDCWLVWTEWRPPGLSVCLPLVMLPGTIKSRRSFLLAPVHPYSVSWRYQ